MIHARLSPQIVNRSTPETAEHYPSKPELRPLEVENKGDTEPGEASSSDLWTRRARPGFLYVMYALLLWAIPMGLIAGVRPDIAEAMTRGMRAYLESLPEPLYTLFGTGYLGYTAARAWGKAKGVER